MTLNYPTNNSFFVSAAGRRLQKQIEMMLAKEDIKNRPAVLIGAAAPFLPAFEQNRPDIIAEKEDLPDNALIPFLPAAGSVSFAFTAVTNQSIADGVFPLIKEIHRILKPQGRFFLLIKNTGSLCPLHIKEMPSFSARVICKNLLQAEFLIKYQQGILFFPFCGKIFDKADDCISALKVRTGCFSFFCAEKKSFIVQTNETYNSARITKASVLTSPRT